MKYTLKNYMLSMKSNWFINQPLYQAVEESIPSIAKYRVSEGTENLEKTPASRMCKNPFPDIYTVPLFRRAWCKMMVEEIKEMEKHIAFKVNDEEDELRQIPEIILRDHVPQLYERMWFVVQTVLNPLFLSLYQRDCFDISAIQIANYNPKDKKAGAWHHDESSDISVVIPLNTGDYIGGGTEFQLGMTKIIRFMSVVPKQKCVQTTRLLMIWSCVKMTMYLILGSLQRYGPFRP